MICEAALCIQQLREYKVLERAREEEKGRESPSVCLPQHLCVWVCFCGVGMLRYNVVLCGCVVVLMCLYLRSYCPSVCDLKLLVSGALSY